MPPLLSARPGVECVRVSGVRISGVTVSGERLSEREFQV